MTPTHITAVEEAIQAFEYMHTAKHIGKVVITIPPMQTIEDKLRSDATYYSEHKIVLV